MARSIFLNHYHCPRCRTKWEGEWCATCDDDCPACGYRHISPTASEETGRVCEHPDCATEMRLPNHLHKCYRIAIRLALAGLPQPTELHFRRQPVSTCPNVPDTNEAFLRVIGAPSVPARQKARFLETAKLLTSTVPRLAGRAAKGGSHVKNLSCLKIASGFVRRMPHCWTTTGVPLFHLKRFSAIRRCKKHVCVEKCRVYTLQSV